MLLIPEQYGCVQADLRPKKGTVTRLIPLAYEWTLCSRDGGPWKAKKGTVKIGTMRTGVISFKLEKKRNLHLVPG